tara:strand:+ start:491 stop:757 length:267 start_codon:yes stop_codon:yes gene_type:complete
MASKYMKAILSLNSNAKCSIPVSFDEDNNIVEDIDNITWENNTTPISKTDITNEATRLDSIVAPSSSGKQKLLDLGLTEEEIKALIGA